MAEFWSLYKGVRKLFGAYWSAYGGWRDLVRSPYLHVASLLALLSVVFADPQDPLPFYDLALSILPNLLGFTLGGFAILMAFGDPEFLGMLCGRRPNEDEDFSPLVSHAANYMHFLVVQGVVLILAVLARATDVKSCVINLVGYFGLYYALFLSLATVASIFRMVRRYDTFKEICNRNRQTPDTSQSDKTHE